MGFFDSLLDYGKQPTAPKAQPAGVRVDDILANLPEYGGAAPPDTTPTQQPYRFNTLPLSVDAKGNYAPAVPGLIKNLYDTAVSGITAPADVLSGALPTPYTVTQRPGTGVDGKPARYDANLNPDPAINRAADFAMTFGADIAPGELAPGTITKSQGAPSATQLKQAGGAGYDAFRASDLQIPQADAAQLAEGMKGLITSEKGIIAESAPQTFATIEKLVANPSTGDLTAPAIMAARMGLSGLSAAGGTEGEAARTALRAFDTFFDKASEKGSVAGTFTPEQASAIDTLRTANANYGAAQRSNDITGEFNRGNTGFVERADARAHATHSGQNVDNAIRQRVASFLQNDKNLAGFSPDEIAALNNVVEGSRTQNALRRGGNLLGGGQGMHGGMLGTVGAVLGGGLGGAEGAGVGAAIPLVGGALAKTLENALARRSLNPVDEMVRSRSPLAEAMAGIDLRQPNYWQNNAALRTMLPNLRFAPGTFNPAPQPVPSPLQGQRLVDFLAAGGA